MVSPRIETGPESKEADSPDPSPSNPKPKPTPPADGAGAGAGASDGGQAHVRAGQRHHLREAAEQDETEKGKEKGADSPSMSARERFQLRHAQQQKEEEERSANEAAAAASPSLKPVTGAGATSIPASGPAATTLASLSGTKGTGAAAEGSPTSIGSGSMRERFRNAQARLEGGEKEREKEKDLDSSLGSIDTLSQSGSPLKPGTKPGVAGAGAGAMAELEEPGESLGSSTGSGSGASPGGKLSAAERFKLRRLKKQGAGGVEKDKEKDASHRDIHQRPHKSFGGGTGFGQSPPQRDGEEARETEQGRAVSGQRSGVNDQDMNMCTGRATVAGVI